LNSGYFGANSGFARAGGFFCVIILNEPKLTFFQSIKELGQYYQVQNSIYIRRQKCLTKHYGGFKMENYQKPQYTHGLKLLVSEEMIKELHKNAAWMGCGISAYIRYLILHDIQTTKVQDTK
jgi:hypothetical protein